MKYGKVHIIGGTGSGKTFLGKAISTRHKISLYEMDDIFWRNIGERVKRSEKERKELLMSVIDTEKWVTEGVFYKWVGPVFDNADIIVVLKVNKWIRLYRMIKRSLNMFLKDPGGYKITFSNLFELVIFNHDYDNVHFSPMMASLEKYKEKTIICSNFRQAYNRLNT